MAPLCKAPECTRPSRIRDNGYCTMHGNRLRRTGTLEATRDYPGRGAAQYFLETACISETDECIVWPFAAYGSYCKYGAVGVNGKTRRVHRVVCERVHGAPPHPDLEAAHKCGVSLCVNPRHLRWATAVENSSDKFRHGTMLRGEEITQSKLNPDAVRQIRLLGKSKQQKEIASLFGVSGPTVSLILKGRTWGWVE